MTSPLPDADEITFLLSQTVNPFYQNPLLPMSISFSCSLVVRLADALNQMNKRVVIDYP